MADPLLAEGVYYALRTGEAAGLAVLDGLAGARDVAAGYAARLEAQVLPGLVQAGRWYKMFAALNRLGAATGLRGLFRMAGAGIEEMVHGERSLRGLRRQEC
jgi:flavin-dependent dehydrogenase